LKRRLAILAAVAICAVSPAHADWDSTLQDCLSDHNKGLHLRHRECFARELGKLPQHTREENGKVLHIMTETAAVMDKNDASDDADERAGVHRTPDPLTALVDCLSDDRFLHLHLRHRECAIREEAKLSQSVREARAEEIRRVLDTAAIGDQNDASADEADRLDAARKADAVRHAQLAARNAQFNSIKTDTDLATWVARYCTGRGEPRIGMTEMEIRESTTWCVPYRINETVTAELTRRQYVYHSDTAGSGGHDGFLYFENSRLVAIQRRN
jgi:hypothetical protein